MKPRSDSKLKTLPPDRQADIADYALDHSLADTVKWLKADGLKTSSAALSEFLSWYRLQQQLVSNETAIAQVLEDLKGADPAMSEEQLDKAGQMFFSALAIQQQDSLTWKRIKDAATRKQLVKLNRDRFEFDAVKACRAKLPELQKVETNRKMTDTEKNEAIREILFPKN